MSQKLYFSFIHSYLNYANITWGSSPRTKQQPLFYRQKHAARLIFYKYKLSPSKPFMKELNTLNVFQLNIYQILLFLCIKLKITLCQESLIKHSLLTTINTIRDLQKQSSPNPLLKAKLHNMQYHLECGIK